MKIACSLFLLLWTLRSIQAWIPPKPFATTTTTTTSLAYSSSSASDDASSSSDNESSSPILERVSISGVSVSPKGFHVFLKTASNKKNGNSILPLPMTRDPMDSYAATSPESLTILQLLSGVDMAGAMLPPETLSKLVVYACELVPDPIFCSAAQRDVLEYVQQSLQKMNDQQSSSYAEAHPWMQSRVKLPQVTLDQLTLVYNTENDKWTCRLECAVKGLLGNKNAGSSSSTHLTMDLTPEIVQPVAYNYDSETSALFTSIALALRYKAPIVLENKNAHAAPIIPTNIDLDQDFPQRTTVSKLQQQSTRVVANIERGFEIHKLTGALQIAMRLGDQGAVARIRAKLDEYDSMDELPTIRKADTAKSEEDDEGLDDLDMNILQ